MAQTSQISFWVRSIQLFLAADLVVALLSMDAIRSAWAQAGNTSLGTGTLLNTTGIDNSALGFYALRANTTGVGNTAAGSDALASNTTGSNNIAFGYNTGSALTTGNNNIDVGNSGVAAESNTIRIGTKDTQTRIFIAGISSAHITGSPVLVNGNGQLGIAVSSARFKCDIRDMGDASAGVLRLRPVSFRYKEDAGTLQYGLIAEEVERVYPELVLRDDDGKVIGVRYDLLPALLLNEMQKSAKQNRQKDVRIAALQRQIVAQQRQISTLQKETSRIDALTARLNTLEEQARMAKPEGLAGATR